MQKLIDTLKPLLDRARTDACAIKDERGIRKVDEGIDEAALRAHLNGGASRGCYPIVAGGSTCRMAVLDLDDHGEGEGFGWDNTSIKAEILIERSRQLGLHGHPWRSSGGKGIHIIYTWDEEQDARSVRARLREVLEASWLKSGTKGLAAGEVEVFPKQDAVAEGRYGNQCWLPLAKSSVPLVDGGFAHDGLLCSTKKRVEEFGYAWVMSGDVPIVARAAAPVRDRGVGGGSGGSARSMTATGVQLRQMLMCVSPDEGYDTWLQVGMAVHDETDGSDEGLDVWGDWSEGGSTYPGREELEYKWGTFGLDGGDGSLVGIGTLQRLAGEGGWVEDVSGLFEDMSEKVVAEMAERGEVALPVFERELSGKYAGKIVASTDNIIMALERPDICGGRIGYDEFTDELMVDEGVQSAAGKDKDKFRGDAQWRRFEHTDYTKMKRRLENKGQSFMAIQRAEMKECVMAVGASDEARIDSAKLWLGGLPAWDGVSRVGTFCSQYWGTQDTEYTRAVANYLWTALAGRVVQPGIKADMAPILVGHQGELKTSVVNALVPAEDYFCEISFHEKEDDLIRLMKGTLVAEIAELKGLNSRDAETIKAFVVRRYEKWVPKYQEIAVRYPRRTMFIGTTNDTEFLADPTGNRRWLPMNAGERAGVGCVADVEGLKRDRDQLWAEGLYMFTGSGEGVGGRAGGIAWREAERLAVSEHGQFAVHHPWEDKIAEWVASSGDLVGSVVEVNLGGDDWGEGLFISNVALYSGALGLGARITGADGRVIGQIMPRLGFKKFRYSGRYGWVNLPQK